MVECVSRVRGTEARQVKARGAGSPHLRLYSGSIRVGSTFFWIVRMVGCEGTLYAVKKRLLWIMWLKLGTPPGCVKRAADL